MTSEQAYLAMFSFLEEHWRRGGSDELAMLLSSMSLLADGNTADPAIARDWSNAVGRATSGQVDATLKLNR
jgi:hypothetical protein